MHIFAAFMAGICASQAATWSVIAVREFLREHRAAPGQPEQGGGS